MPNQPQQTPKENLVSDNSKETEGGADEQTVIQEKELFNWKAPARPFKRRDKHFWTTVVVIAVLIGFLMFIIDGVMPVILIVTVVFFYYVLSTVEPETISFSITNKGAKVFDKRTEWNELTRFWFTKRYNDELLVFEKTTFPGRLEVVINSKDKDKIREILKKYVIEEEVPPSKIDKAANWFAKKLPGNQ